MLVSFEIDRLLTNILVEKPGGIIEAQNKKHNFLELFEEIRMVIKT